MTILFPFYISICDSSFRISVNAPPELELNRLVFLRYNTANTPRASLIEAYSFSRNKKVNGGVSRSSTL